MKYYFQTNPHKIFFLDGIGACMSVVFLSILAHFEMYFGMPQNVLYALASFASIFAIYSFSCYFFKVKDWQFYLKIIALANLFYCCLSLFLMVYFYEKLTIFGLTYFLVEKFIVLVLIFLEWKVFKNHS